MLNKYGKICLFIIILIINILLQIPNKTLAVTTSLCAYTIQSYNIDMIVNDDNTFDITEITTGISKIIAISENYPELKSSKNFVQLSSQLVSLGNDIENSRKYYNGTVRNYNNKIQMFPSNIIANIFRFKDEKMFEVNLEEKNNVKVDL